MKKFLALLLALMLLLSLTACGGGNDTPDPSGSEDNTPSSSQQQDEQPSSTPDDGGEDESGGNENTEEMPYGEDMKSEVGLSVEEIQPDSIDSYENKFTAWSGWSTHFASVTGAKEENVVAYLKKLYDITAAVSDGGTNYKPTADVSNPAKPPEELVPAGTFDEEITSWDYGAAWYYKYNDEVILVNVSYYINTMNGVTVKIDNVSR